MVPLRVRPNLELMTSASRSIWSRSLATFGVLGFVSSARACPTCGLNQSFSPLMLLISTGFVILPIGFAAFIAWRVYKDSKSD